MIKISYNKILCLFFVVFFSLFSSAQQSKEEQQIDREIDRAKEFYNAFKVKQLLMTSKDIVLKSEKSNYQKGLVYGNFYIACAFSYIGKYKESNNYINKSQTYYDYLESDPIQESENYGLLGRNYLRLDLYSLSFNNLKKAIDVVSKAKDNDYVAAISKSIYYGRLSILYERKGMQDSMYYYLNKEKAIYINLKNKASYLHTGNSHIRLGNYFYAKKIADSSRYYYEKALLEFKGKNHRYEVDVLVGLGNIYNVEGNDKEAFRYYSDAVKVSKRHNSWELHYAYRVISELYEKNGDYVKAKEFITLSKKITDRIETNKKIERDYVVNEVIKFEKEIEDQKNASKNLKFFSIIIFLIIISSIGIFYMVKRKRKELISEKETIIHLKENIITKKEEENEDLKQKVNESFEEVIQLAKENSIEFFTRFKEVYPEVVSKLLEIDPRLRVTELTLCAYFFLGFTTKDIAKYTFRSVNTIRNRRQNLRSKLNIQSEENIELWFKNLSK